MEGEICYTMKVVLTSGDSFDRRRCKDVLNICFDNSTDYSRVLCHVV